MKLGYIDAIVLVAYGAGMLAIGWYFSRRTASTDDYLLGGRQMKPWSVGLSLFASLLSAISYLAYPAEMIEYGPMVFAGFISFPLIVLVVGWFLIPAVMRSRATSAYEILDLRFGPAVRFAGSLIFVSLRLIWMGFIIFLLATKLLVPLLGLEPTAALWVSALVGLVTVVYTSLGGLRAVVLTDVIQTFILFGGALLALVLIHDDLGGFSGWWPTTWAENWEPPRLFYDPEAPEARTFLGAGLAIFCWHVCTAGSDQVAIQRYLATRDTRSARRAFIWSLTTDVVVLLFLGVLGLALLGYFRAHPEQLPEGKTLAESSRQLFLQFMVTGLPAGLSGLVIAGLLAAAMSSLSSGLNSVSAVVSVDFFQRFSKRHASEAERVRLARYFSWAIGAVIVVLSLVVGEVDRKGNIFEQAQKTVNLLVSPLFVLFLMAFFVPWATATGTLLGCAASIVVAVLIATETIPLNFLWLMPSALVAGAATGMLCSLLPPGRRRAG